MSEGFMKVDFDKETVALESSEKRWTKGATVQVVLTKVRGKNSPDPRRKGAHTPGATFFVGVVHPDTGKVIKGGKPIIMWCGMPLRDTENAPDLQPREYTMGSGSTWHSLCAGFVDGFDPVTFEGNKCFVAGEEIDRAEVKSHKKQLGGMRSELAAKYYKEEFKSLLNNNVAYGEIDWEGDWDKVKNLRKVQGDVELTPYDELMTLDIGEEEEGGAKKKKAPAPKKKKRKNN